MGYEFSPTETCPYCFSENTAYMINDMWSCMECQENFYKGSQLDKSKIKKNQLNFYLVKIKSLHSSNINDRELQVLLRQEKSLKQVKNRLVFFKNNVSEKMKTLIDQFFFIYEEGSEWD